MSCRILQGPMKSILCFNTGNADTSGSKPLHMQRRNRYNDNVQCNVTPNTLPSSQYLYQNLAVSNNDDLDQQQSTGEGREIRPFL